ncbi:dual specificity mitogen-activated protein kinase kinase hemipterous-like isoform X2 [Anopheles aquasalis]|uniref:dual specificity mitogen-activated protein kinase kinase hemipterous-like isoform X2 n=1 Tax=Anopheles aquasalis TaxID=42839 RepID=UPI00215B5435|nr:dual specificity mitogen-activated protein kinase kinase hemipterous-like isoform X2 [Anopheles aquasalis]
MQPTGTQPGGPSDNSTSNGTTMSAGSSIGTRISEIERSIATPRSMLPPMNFGGPRRPVGLPLPIPDPRPNRSESEQKFLKIIEKNGLLTINNQTYRTQLSDLDDLGELGSGTSGHVVKMRHNPSGTIIAVKQMRRTGNDEENKRIIMDLDVVLKSENCKHIVKCLGCFITDADVWICMELMTTCFDKLQKKSKKPVPEEILGKVTVSTVRALAYLKDNHRVIHRDVKPSNILIDDHGNIKLCDFGISGRLVDSNARTRSAGCAAYMAPERIDPAKTVYDIRADVWSLGITLVELATGVFPYRGCVTDFEVLTQVLTSNPPRLPEDQPFSPEFRDFVQRCLQKDYQARPKYPDLLRHAFLQRAEQDTSINVGEWFRNVAVNCGIQLTSLAHRTPATGTGTASVSSAPTASRASSSEQTRIPTPLGSLTEAVQAQSNQQKQTIAIAASSIPIKSGSTSNTLYTATSSPHIANSSNEPNHLILSQRAVATAEQQLQQQIQQHHQQQQQQQHQQQLLQSKLSNISLATGSAHTTTSSSAPVFDPRRSPSPQAPYHLSKLQPKSAITSTGVPIASERNGTLGAEQQHHHQLPRKYKHSPFLTRRTAAASSNNGSEYGSGSPKKESTLSSLGQSIFKNLTTSPFSQRKSLANASGGESKLGTLASPPYTEGTGSAMDTYMQTNGSNPSSPLPVLRKAQHDTGTTTQDDTQYKHLHGNTSPIVLQRFYHQQNQLYEQQREAQQKQHPHAPQTAIYISHGNNSIVNIAGAGATTAAPDGSSPHMIRFSPLPAHRTVHHGVHPIVPSATVTNSALYRDVVATSSPPLHSGIPIYQQQLQQGQHHPAGTEQSPAKQRASAGGLSSSGGSFFSTISRGMKSAGRSDKVIDRSGGAGNGGTGAAVIAGTTGSNAMLGVSPATERTLYGTTNQPIYATGHHGNPGTLTEGLKDETDRAKRHFHSFVKLNLSNSVGAAGGSGPAASDKRMFKEKHHYQSQLAAYPQPAFDGPASGLPATSGAMGVGGGGAYGTVGPFAGGYTVQPPSAIPTAIGQAAPSSLAHHHVLSGAAASAADRRHRSPDPPPRFNRGQSPLLLQRKLEQLGHTGSPLLNRRPFTSTSPSPPLPPRRGSESVPGSPQHLRTRINYTPEPHRRPYRTTIDQ